MNDFSHIDEYSRPVMVDISDKRISHRIAEAEGWISLEKNTIALINDDKIKKGNIFICAELAGIQGAKKTSELIPLCHPIPVTKIDVRCTLEGGGVKAVSLVKSTGKTGVEMEALTAVSAALLTIYDMCKAVDKNMEISKIRLVRKEKTEAGES